MTSMGELQDVEELRLAVQDFAKERIAPYAEQVDRQNSFPQNVNLWKEMGDFGLHGHTKYMCDGVMNGFAGVTAPGAYGGLGLGYLHQCVVMEELSRASGSVALAYGAHSNLCITQLCRHANKQQSEKYLPALIAGDLLP